MKRPLIQSRLPGPNAKKWVNLDSRFVSPSYTRVYPLVVEKAKGLWIHDVDDNVFLDFTSGIAVCSTGRCHPAVARAIKHQADALLHMSGVDRHRVPGRPVPDDFRRGGAGGGRVGFSFMVFVFGGLSYQGERSQETGDRIPAPGAFRFWF